MSIILFSLGVFTLILSFILMFYSNNNAENIKSMELLTIAIFIGAIAAKIVFP